MAETKYDPILDDLRADDTNFSFDVIKKKLVIPENQQMIVFGGVNIQNCLIIRGNLILKS